ncbi:MAG: CoA pyrophosphatase [Pseudomonadota bacterium]
MSFSTLEDFLARAERHLDPIEGDRRLEPGGDLDLVDRAKHEFIRPAAVLIPIIPREAGPTALLTQRPKTMAAHPGQVAFPGGKVDPVDRDEVAAALREAQEEVGVDPSKVDLVARGANYFTGTAFQITPVIGVLSADFVPRPDPGEVADVFEAPLSFLFDTSNHRKGEAVWQGQRRTYVEMPWNGFRIWGVTAGIIQVLHNTLYATET